MYHRSWWRLRRSPKAKPMAAEIGALVHSHIGGEVHRSFACGTSRSRKFNNKSTERIHSSSSHPNVIKPKQHPTILLSTTGASSLGLSRQSTGSWPPSPSCAVTARDSCLPMEGCDQSHRCSSEGSSRSRQVNPTLADWESWTHEAETDVQTSQLVRIQMAAAHWSLKWPAWNGAADDAQRPPIQRRPGTYLSRDGPPSNTFVHPGLRDNLLSH